VAQVFQQVQSEVQEVEDELNQNIVDKAKVAEEIGDLYFSLAQLCRHLDLDPETTALAANQKFLRRFSQLEALAEKEGFSARSAPQQELERLWQAVKALEKSPS